MTETTEYRAIEAQCIDCQDKFTISPEAQAFFASKRLENGQPLKNPKRCGPCRGKNRRKHGTDKIVREKPADPPRAQSMRFDAGMSDKELLEGVEPTRTGPNGERIWSVA